MQSSASMYFLIIFLVFPSFANAMEDVHQDIPTRKRPAEVELDQSAKVAKNSMFSLLDLGADIHYPIISCLTYAAGKDEAEQLKNASRNIRSLMLVNKAFSRYAHDPKLNKLLIKAFAKRYDQCFLDPVLALKTPAARHFMDELIRARKRIFATIDEENKTELFKKFCFQNIHAALSADERGITPLMFAVHENDENAVNVLLSLVKNKKWLQEYINVQSMSGGCKMQKYKATISDSSRRFRFAGGQTALHIAAGSGSVSLVQKLIAAGASLSKKDINGDTPLHLTVSDLPREEYIKDYVQIAQYLLDAGADKTEVNNFDMNPLESRLDDLFSDEGDKENDPIVTLLRRYGLQSQE